MKNETIERIRMAGEYQKKAIRALFPEKMNEVLFQETVYCVDQEKQMLSVYLPFADRDDLDLEQGDKELTISVRGEHRRFPIPAEFSRKEIAGAKFEEGYLNIFF